jgi:hypothetical protein
MSEEQDVKIEQPVKSRTPKLSAEKALPYSGADAIVKIIKGYVVASNAGESPVKHTDVASATGLNSTNVSGNNAFLSESQILTSPKYGYYVPSEEATRFAREAAWDEEKAKLQLRKVIARCWYGQVAIQNLALRSSLSRGEFKKSLAIKAGATEGDANALDRLIDFIVYTGLVLQDNAGVLTKGNLDEIETADSIVPRAGEPVQVVTQGKGDVYVQNKTENAVSVVVHVHLKDWNDLTSENAVRLREWLDKVGMPVANIETEVGTPPSSN